MTKATDLNFLTNAYYQMAHIRAFEKKIWDLTMEKPPSVVGSVHLCAGQEAIAVGACAALDRKRDKIVTTYRGHGWALAWGIDPAAAMGEICHRETGLNGGRAGSAMMMDPKSGFIGENSIVAAGAPIATGVALALRSRGTGGIVVVTVGDGAMNQGAMHEAMVFAAAQKLPVIFICENNGWSEMTPIDRIVLQNRLSKRGGGYGITSATIDGNDPLAVRDSLLIAVERARQGEGPALIECKTVRLWGHYNGDVEHYRPSQDRENAERADPLPRLRQLLQAAGADKEAARILIDVDSEIELLAARALAAATPDPASARAHVFVPAEPGTEKPQPEGASEITYQRAVNEALRRELAARDDVLVFGEDVGHAGGIFGCTRNLQREFGEGRVFDTPIAESAILGSAVGASVAGLRPVVEIMWADFSLVALDQLINQAANVAFVTQGRTSAPMVVRMQQGATPGSCPQHSQSLEAIFAHIPGLKVGLPSTPQDAYSMLRAAVADPNPVIVIEARSLYQTRAQVDFGLYDTAVGGSRLVYPGTQGMVLTYGTARIRAEAAVTRLRAEGHDIGLLDLRWLNPVEWEEIHAIVVSAGGAALIVHEANLTAGFGAEIAARLWERGARRVSRVAVADSRIPASPVLQSALIPSEETIREAILKIARR